MHLFQSANTLPHQVYDTQAQSLALLGDGLVHAASSIISYTQNLSVSAQAQLTDLLKSNTELSKFCLRHKVFPSIRSVKRRADMLEAWLGFLYVTLGPSVASFVARRVVEDIYLHLHKET